MLDRNGTEVVLELGSAEGHHCYLASFSEPDGGHRATCQCGATWTYPEDRTVNQMVSIYESHLSYFNRPKLVTL